MLLGHPKRIFDVFRILEVARCCVDPGIYKTWFMLQKLVVPNEDVDVI